MKRLIATVVQCCDQSWRNGRFVNCGACACEDKAKELTPDKVAEEAIRIRRANRSGAGSPRGVTGDCSDRRRVVSERKVELLQEWFAELGQEEAGKGSPMKLCEGECVPSDEIVSDVQAVQWLSSLAESIALFQ